MGSRKSDYDYVNDPFQRLYKDQDAIQGRAVDDMATVTLTNGGSFQKNEDFYQIAVDPSKPQKKKYHKNKYFYIDPFELTIAQWCYVKGWNTTASARSNLEGKLDEMRRSYWKYLYTYETGSWNTIVQNNGVTVSDDIEDMLDQLAVNDSRSPIYNPLEDTRPYYYATYNDVRGTTQVYTTVSGTPATYVFDRSKGDEFQMNTRSGSTATSFIDLLNQKVVNGCYERNNFVS